MFVVGGEIRNHWVRDAIFEEDRPRWRNLNLNANLALLRGTLIALKARLCPDLSRPALRELCAADPATAYLA
jgi:predicted transposase YbfD/YdcC